MWDAFKTYDLGNRAAFETLNNQLFERYINRTYASSVQKFRVVNGAGGDGGVEAYAELTDGNIIAVQSKWFRNSMQTGEIAQIKDSILIAKKVRPKIREYIICIPRNLSSKKMVRGGKLSTNDEDARVVKLIDEIHSVHPDLKLTWWFDNELLGELQQPDNEGVHKFWFEKEMISLSYLKDQFSIQKQNNWLKDRYIPELHGSGIIYQEYLKMIFSQDHRKKLSEQLQEKLNKLDHCSELIAKFIDTKEYPSSVKEHLEKVQNNLQEFKDEIARLQDAIINGNGKHHVKEIKEEQIWPVTLELEKIKPTHRQKPILQKLIKYLRDMHASDLPNYILDFEKSFHEVVKLVRGAAGTGKTHGLANCVEQHLEKNLPALIVQAKNTPCSNWSEILSRVLELPAWNRNEIFSALESIAVSRDVAKATALKSGEELEEPESKVLICIDGLEEETGKETEWCSRISETTVLSEKYPRIRFLFSARDYFKRHCIDPYNKIWEEVDLPREGDVSVWNVAEDYLKAFNIMLENLSQIKGIDNLLALRLFCEEYEGQEINLSTHIVTATRDLLKLKAERINREFLSSLQGRSLTQQPVFDALLTIAEVYYYSPEVEHTVLRKAILQKVDSTLSPSEVDLLLDFFVRHGILIRISEEDESEVLPKTNHYYRITYQSIIEHILSEKIYQDIKSARIEAIPDILHQGIVQPLDVRSQYDVLGTPPNQRIIQSIVNRLFAETGKLIGENGFLTQGFSESDIVEMKFEAIRCAPKERSIQYKPMVDRLFFADLKSQFLILKHLIIPSAPHAENIFGSEYLHQILMNQPSAFERDLIWSGLDRYEAHKKKAGAYQNNTKEALIENRSILFLSEYEDYNERPLLYAWALSNIDQGLRNAARVALTGWAIKRPEEFIKLLDKIFFCNDPQIQEDLASVMLGIASHLSEVDQLNPLAEWALKNIFPNWNVHRNVIVRQGFRAIVEKAFLKGCISEKEVQMCRPHRLSQIELLGLDIDSMPTSDENYPIEHDLAWYVIKNAYEKFLEYPSQERSRSVDNDCPEAKALLDLYRIKYATPHLFAHGWSMAAAIHYIRKTLGLTRDEGSGYTDESHGSKSKIFTYEEKYTWLTVHYLQGYLSDYIPMESNSTREWVEDYLQLSDIPNPGEEAFFFKKADQIIRDKNSDWLIKEDLAPTISADGNIEENIKAWVQEEPSLNFSNWLHFDGKDFPGYGPGKKWLALRNYTALNDASESGYSHLIAIAALIPKDDFEAFKKIIEKRPERSLHFVTHIDGLKTSPDTSTYCNPSDIVWMDWIKEYSEAEIIYLGSKESKLFYTITELTQDTVDGERFYKIPSKLVRKLLGIQSYSDDELQNNAGEVISFIHKKSEGEVKDKQELVLINADLLEKKLEEQDLKIVWLVDHFKEKNPLNKSLQKGSHTQKTRKYLVWKEGDNFLQLKFWDEYFNNTRDERKKAAELSD